MGRFSSSLSRPLWAYSLAEATTRDRTGIGSHCVCTRWGPEGRRVLLSGNRARGGADPPPPHSEQPRRWVPGSPGRHSLCGSSLERMGWAPLTAAAVRVFTPLSAASHTVLTWGWLSLVEV